ncbi:LPXTG cell wall anchor domain-containing protein [Nakamurella antarctica]|uniref:LPXTG cell wall anchor domain-containing protein n=2 Tax=Nakamurella antarctica TaxID=1902245 RepID=A0A3G8ZZN6_9ACTN|nr:LPXTG cell wall anchor domain-containing protein [Nakamurella antarctica]
MPTPGPGTTVKVSAETVVAGGSLSFTGSGFIPGESVAVWLNSDPILLGRVVADANGTVAGVVTIGPNTAPGAHSIQLIGDSSRTASASIIVLAASSTDPDNSTASAPLAHRTSGAPVPAPALARPELAQTGVNPAVWLSAGIIALLAGAMLTVTGRRRRT